jgi:hypothetical protein
VASQREVLDNLRCGSSSSSSSVCCRSSSMGRAEHHGCLPECVQCCMPAVQAAAHKLLKNGRGMSLMTC